MSVCASGISRGRGRGIVLASHTKFFLVGLEGFDDAADTKFEVALECECVYVGGCVDVSVCARARPCLCLCVSKYVWGYLGVSVDVCLCV